MTTINKLSAADSLDAADQIPIYSATNGDARKVSGTQLAEFVQENITVNDDKITQYSAPSATSFTVVITDSDDSIWLVLTPVADYAAGTITLPSLANSVDKQEVLVNSTHAITTLTVGGNGATVTGAPTTLAANGFFRMRFEGVTKTWYRCG